MDHRRCGIPFKNLLGVAPSMYPHSFTPLLRPIVFQVLYLQPLVLSQLLELQSTVVIVVIIILTNHHSQHFKHCCFMPPPKVSAWLVAVISCAASCADSPSEPSWRCGGPSPSSDSNPQSCLPVYKIILFHGMLVVLICLSSLKQGHHSCYARTMRMCSHKVSVQRILNVALSIL